MKKAKPSELRLQQLRSFCETARLGSLTAAAQALGLTQPTIGEQVHALEREFAEKLVEPHGRGCRLTEAGQTLATLAGPLIAGIDSLKARYEEARQKQQSRFTIACSPRVLAEDILDCLPEFEREHPEAHVRCQEMPVDIVAEAVQAGHADLGLTLSDVIDRQSPWIEVEDGYEMDVLLVTPKNHPLSTKRDLSLADIAACPVVNRPESLADRTVAEALRSAGVFSQQSAKVEAAYTVAVRGFVEQGFGIGFVFGVPGRQASAKLSERSISHLVGRIRIDFVWRRGAIPPRLAREFANTIKTSMRAKFSGENEAKSGPSSGAKKK